MTTRPDRSRPTHVALALLLALPLACGGGSDAGENSGRELFAGNADELVPHETGRSARFRVTARQDGESRVSSFTVTVIANDGDAFTTRYVSATGAVADGTSRDLGDEIVVVRFVNDPGGSAEEVRVLDPPAGVVRTPVVAGEAIESGFVRTLELGIRVGSGQTEQRTVVFTGSARRVPEERGPVRVADGTYDDAIRYAVSARGRTTIPVLGQSVAVEIDVRGDEWFAVGVGGVREDLEVGIRAGDERTTVVFTTEREGAPS
ncbi:hypothetical protein K2Z84_20705 [Candidatus Binatia bacterium]|nr:hypothetical protein [Candidatus Binatia bacterium]